MESNGAEMELEPPPGEATCRRLRPPLRVAKADRELARVGESGRKSIKLVLAVARLMAAANRLNFLPGPALEWPHKRNRPRIELSTRLAAAPYQ